MKQVTEMDITKVTFTAFDSKEETNIVIEGKGIIKYQEGLPSGLLGVMNDIFVTTVKLGEGYYMEDIVYAMEDLEKKAEDYKNNISGRSDSEFVIDGIKNLVFYEGESKREFSNLFELLKEYGLQEDDGTGIGSMT